MRSLTLAALSLATLPLALALSSPAPAQDGPILLSPQAIGHIFCLARIGNDMAPVTGLLTPGLEAVIAEAEARNDAIAAAHPDDKPPLGDGIPWQSWPDYAATCTVGTVIVSDTTSTVTIDYGFPDAPDADFTDTLMLAAVPDPLISASRWRIDNIAYAVGGDLQAALAGAFAD